MPNWLFDVVCVSAAVASDIKDQLAVDVGEVCTPRKGPTGVKQIIPAHSAVPWYRPEQLERAARARHGQFEGDRTGSFCAHRCGCWKWLPVGETDAPIAVIASPETFGDGLQSSRHLLFRRALGEALAAASQRHWDLVEVEIS